jgi:hypothetical protein
MVIIEAQQLISRWRNLHSETRIMTVDDRNSEYFDLRLWDKYHERIELAKIILPLLKILDINPHERFEIQEDGKDK